MSEPTISKHVSDGYHIWMTDHGAWHNPNGPAYEDNSGRKEWHMGNRLHREDGPAIITSSDIFPDYYYEGKQHTSLIREWCKELDIEMHAMTNDDRIIINLKWMGFCAERKNSQHA